MSNVQYRHTNTVYVLYVYVPAWRKRPARLAVSVPRPIHTRPCQMYSIAILTQYIYCTFVWSPCKIRRTLSRRYTALYHREGCVSPHQVPHPIQNHVTPHPTELQLKYRIVFLGGLNMEFPSPPAPLSSRSTSCATQLRGSCWFDQSAGSTHWAHTHTRAHTQAQIYACTIW